MNNLFTNYRQQNALIAALEGDDHFSFTVGLPLSKIAPIN